MPIRIKLDELSINTSKIIEIGQLLSDFTSENPCISLLNKNTVDSLLFWQKSSTSLPICRKRSRVFDDVNSALDTYLVSKRYMFAPSENRRSHTELMSHERGRNSKIVENQCFSVFLELSSRNHTENSVCNGWFHEGATLYRSYINVLNESILNPAVFPPAFRQIGKNQKSSV